MGPVVVNGSVHTARKQDERKNIPICVRVASSVLCELGPEQPRWRQMQAMLLPKERANLPLCLMVKGNEAEFWVSVRVSYLTGTGTQKWLVLL